MSEIKSMFLEIKDNIESNKEVRKLKQVFTCVICQETSAAVMFFLCDWLWPANRLFFYVLQK